MTKCCVQFWCQPFSEIWWWEVVCFVLLFTEERYKNNLKSEKPTLWWEVFSSYFVRGHDHKKKSQIVHGSYEKSKSKIKCWKKYALFVVWFSWPLIWWMLHPLKSLSQVHILQNTYSTQQVMQELMHRDGSGIPFYIWDTASYQSKELDTGFPNPSLLLQWPMTLISLTLDCVNVWMFCLHF